MSSTSLKVLSCVPKQLFTFEDKRAWAEAQIKRHKPDLLVLPQEYHGGIQTEFFPEARKSQKVAYTEQEILQPYEKLAKKYKVGITVGSLIDDPILNERRERIFVIDSLHGTSGYVDKMFLPAYDHVDALGKTRVYPESDFNKRAVAFDCMGARVSVMFCWEVYSSYLWHAIARAQPDFLIEMIKFGVKGWPRKEKDVKTKESIVAGFGFGGDGGWIERLQVGAKWDLAAPIVCSTNSWNLPAKCGALCGVILPFEEKETQGDYARAARASSLWCSEGKGTLSEDKISIDVIDFMYWRYIRDHKFALNEATRTEEAPGGNWPSSEARTLTMNWKIKRMERKAVGLPKLMAKENHRGLVDTAPGAHNKTSQPGLFDDHS